MKNIYFIILSILIMIYIISSIRKNKLSISTSFVWIVGTIVMLILSIFPKSLDWLAIFLGITYPPALFLTICVIVLLISNFNFSKKIESQEERITDLTQELSIVKEKVNGKK